jgi:hypothetical protein
MAKLRAKGGPRPQGWRVGGLPLEFRGASGALDTEHRHRILPAQRIDLRCRGGHLLPSLKCDNGPEGPDGGIVPRTGASFRRPDECRKYLGETLFNQLPSA